MYKCMVSILDEYYFIMNKVLKKKGEKVLKTISVRVLGKI